MSKINICFITDDNYAMPTCIAASSIQQLATKNTCYDCYILCRNVKPQKKEKFTQLDNEHFKIILIDLDEKYDFSKYHIDGIPATSTSICKFFIPTILDKLNHVIYLDGDIIVKKDLTELYSTNLNGNYIGAVKDNNGLDHKDMLGPNYSYINSGVLLMDLAAMRQDGISEKLFDYRKNGYNKLMDQDTFNYVLKDHILHLPFKYNTQMNALSRIFENKSDYTLKRIKRYWNLQPTDTITSIISNSYILHYATAKPWKYYDGYGNDLWLHYYLMSPYRNDNIERTSRYIQEISKSTTFNVGKKIITPITASKKLIKNIKNKERIRFLANFK